MAIEDIGHQVFASSGAVGRWSQDLAATKKLDWNVDSSGNATATPSGGTFAVVGTVSVDTIAERTLNNGVAVDGVVLKDAGITATGGGSLTGTWSDLGTVTTVDINGGSIDGAVIGAAAAAAGTFTALNASGGGALTGTWTDLGSVTTVDINGGTLAGMTVDGDLTWSSTQSGMTLSSPTINGTVATTGLTMPAFTMSGTLSRAADQTIDLTGATTRTLAIRNSTASQVTNVDTDGVYAWAAGDATGKFTFAGVPTVARTITWTDASITVNAATDISGTTLASNVVTSSLTTIGTLIAGAVVASLVTAGTFAAGAFSFAGSTIADGGTVTTVNIDGGTLAGVTVDGDLTWSSSQSGMTIASPTINGTITSATDLTIDLTGAATSTLTVQNSTASQVTDLDLDGVYKWRAGHATGIFSYAGAPTAARTITWSDASITVNAAADISGTTLASNVVTSSLTTVAEAAVTAHEAALTIVATQVTAGTFAAGTFSFAGSTISDLGTVTTANIDGGSIDGTTLGSSSASTGAFTSLSSTLDVTVGDDLLFSSAGGNVVVGTGALATTATEGFVYISSSAGVPTGVPTTFTGRVPVTYNTTSDIFYVYNSGWQAVSGGGGLSAAADEAITGAWTFGNAAGVTTDKITELTPAAGVTIDSVLLKDDGITCATGVYSGIVSIDDTTDTTSTVTGSMHTDGGVGIALDLWVGVDARIVGSLHVSGNGPHTIGGGDLFNHQGVRFAPTFASGGLSNEASILTVAGQLTGFAGDIAGLWGTNYECSIVTQTATEDIAQIAQLNVNAPGITDNLTGNIDFASILRLVGAPTAGVVNYSLNNTSTVLSNFAGPVTIVGVGSFGGNVISTNASGNWAVGTAALATTATDGFIYMATEAGTPTGVPTTFTGRAAFSYDTTGDVFYVYNSGWQAVGGGVGDTVNATGEVITGNWSFTNTGDFEVTGPIYINETANANITKGLTVQMGTNTNQIMCFKSSTSVSHGLTTATVKQDVEDDDFFTISKAVDAEGGVLLQALMENSASNVVFQIEAYGGIGDNAKNSGARGLIEVLGIEHDGSNALVNSRVNGNIFCVRSRVGAANIANFVVDEDGDLHASNATVGSGLDEWDDRLALRAMELFRPIGIVRTQWDRMVRYGEKHLIEMGVLGDTIARGGLLNVTGMQRLQSGAIWQNFMGVKENEVDIEVNRRAIHDNWGAINENFLSIEQVRDRLAEAEEKLRLLEAA